jgi:hypothetical protein
MWETKFNSLQMLKAFLVLTSLCGLVGSTAPPRISLIGKVEVSG